MKSLRTKTRHIPMDMDRCHDRVQRPVCAKMRDRVEKSQRA